MTEALRGTSSKTRRSPKLIVVGGSTGGPAALRQLLAVVGENLTVPLLVAQHMHIEFAQTLLDSLRKDHGHSVKESTDGAIADAGVHLPPGGCTLLVEAGPRLRHLRDDSLAIGGPSVDMLFTSAARAFGEDVVAVVLSGMGVDGLNGAREVAERGGTVLAQSRESSSVWGMPGAVVSAGLASVEGDPSHLGGVLRHLLSGS